MKYIGKRVLSKNNGPLRVEDYLDLLDIIEYRNWLSGVYRYNFVEGKDEFYRDLMEGRHARTAVRNSVPQSTREPNNNNVQHVFSLSGSPIRESLTTLESKDKILDKPNRKICGKYRNGECFGLDDCQSCSDFIQVPLETFKL